MAALEAKLAELSQQFEEATAEKNEAVAQAEKTQMRASMADRLVNGLADEKVRWSKAVESFGVQEAQFVGDVLLASAFVSYVGAFNLQLRGSLVSEKWIPDMSNRKIPMTDGMHPLEVMFGHRKTVVTLFDEMTTNANAAHQLAWTHSLVVRLCVLDSPAARAFFHSET